jgi:hypothetical protein
MTQWPRSPRRACNNTIRVRRDVAEQISLRPVLDPLLAPAIVAEMVAEMRAYYEQCMPELWTEGIKVPAEVEELNRCIARLQERRKSGGTPI